jgi:putative tricarboxylic transport membrane protein
MSDQTLKPRLDQATAPSPALPDEWGSEHSSIDASSLAPTLSPAAEGEFAAATALPVDPAAMPESTAQALLPRAFSRRLGGMVVAALLAAAGAIFAWQAAFLDIGNIDLPGPGFFPLALGGLLVIFSVAIGVDYWRLPERETIEIGHRDVLLVIAALLAVPLLFEPLGALSTLGLFGATLLVLVARVRIMLAIVAAALGSTACWYFFQVLLGLQLPAGPF